MAKKKAPAFQFYVRDWLSEPEVRRLSPASRGIWIDILAYMWLEEERGKLEVEIPELARMCGASETEIQTFLREAERVDLCSVSRFCPENVPACPENVRLVSRRMHREWKASEYERLRKREQRASSKCPENVPAPSSSASSSASALDTKTSSSNTQNSSSPTKPGEGGARVENPPPRSGPKQTNYPSKSHPAYVGFKSCFEIYPLQENEVEGWRVWHDMYGRGLLPEPFVIRDHIIERSGLDEKWLRGIVPAFHNFLRDQRWNDKYKRGSVAEGSAPPPPKPGVVDEEAA